MARKVFLVSAFIFDANGTFNFLSGYPKTFDSNNYSQNAERARLRAGGDLSETWGAMCKADTRQVQTVCMTDEKGFMLECKTRGDFPMPTPNLPEE